MQECRANGSENYAKLSQLNIFPTRKFLKLSSQGNQRYPDYNPLKPPLVRWDSLSGDPVIDEQLREIIELLFRDIVVPWFSSISDRDDVIDDLKNIVFTVVRNINSRVNQIDKVHYLTTQLVDDFASHLRLYRSAEQRLRIQKLQDANANLLSIFFDLEFQMEKNKLCRDVVSEHNETFLNYLTRICDTIMYLLLPLDTFDSRLIRYSLQHLIVHSILYPFFEMISDPDFINQTLVSLCKNKANQPSTPDNFLTIIRNCDDTDELNAVLEIVNKEIAIQRSRDTGGDDDFEIKQQLSSLLLVQSVIKQRFKCLNEGSYDEVDTNGLTMNLDLQKFTGPGSKLFQIPFDVVLKNNIAISYFIEYMASIGQQGYVYFYLNVEGFRISAEQQLAEAAITGQACADSQSLQEAAINIYDTYLNPESRSNHKIKIDEDIACRIYHRIKNEPLSETWFDEAQEQVLQAMKDNPNLFPKFKVSIHYIKLLSELDLLKEAAVNHNNNNNNHGHINSLSHRQNSDEDSLSIDSRSSIENDCVSDSYIDNPFCATTKTNEDFGLKAEISNTGIVREFGNSYGVYCISVSRRESTNEEEKWCILRRYSDFDSLHQVLCQKFETEIRNKLFLPGKRPFNNVNVEFLEQRRNLLNNYLQQIIRLYDQGNVAGLKDAVNKFLEPGNYDKGKTSQIFSKAVNNLVVNPFKSSVKSVGSVVKVGSDNIRDGFQKLARLGSISSNSSGVSSASSTNYNRSNGRQRPSLSPSASVQSNLSYPEINSDKVGAALESETEIDNIPLRVMLLLMDEVFDLKSKNLWLRRRIVAVIRQIIKSTFGDTINRKILDFVEDLTSASAISDYLKYSKSYFWPNNGRLLLTQGERNHNTKKRTKVAAKLLLLSTFSDELKHIIGTETARKGLLCVFQMFQNETLNRRLMLVLFEGLLQQLFPNNFFPLILSKIHSTSPRMQEWLKTNESDISWPPNLNHFHGRTASSSAHSSNKSSPLHGRRR